MTSTNLVVTPPLSRQQAVVRSILAISEGIRNRLERDLELGDVTLQQFNVLRILAEAGDGGLPTLVVAQRLLERAPGITRLMDHLERQGLVRRERGVDRRQVICAVTDRGAALVREIGPAIRRAEEIVVSCLNPNELGALHHFLNRVRGNLSDT
jgi:DNA-binding MarR family transcriptional regulator